MSSRFVETPPQVYLFQQVKESKQRTVMSDTNQNKQEGGTTRWLKSLFTSTNKNLEQPKAPQENEVPKNLPQAERKNKTVLVVDDDPVFLKAASIRLNADGYDVITAKEGSEAIQIARKNKPDALVLDVNLPRDVAGVPWDGFSVMTWIRRFDDLKQVPVVFASNTDSVKLADRLAGTIDTAFFQKTMEPELLTSLVNQGIEQPRTTMTATGNFQI
jgi:CheY-like chemotaxis protein